MGSWDTERYSPTASVAGLLEKGFESNLGAQAGSSRLVFYRLQVRIHPGECWTPGLPEAQR